MHYEHLSTEYQLDVLVEALHSREQEHFHYEFDLINFRHMLTLAQNPEEVTQLNVRIEATLKQQAIVSGVLTALRMQKTNWPSSTFEQAIQRVSQKQARVDTRS